MNIENIERASILSKRLYMADKSENMFNVLNVEDEGYLTIRCNLLDYHLVADKEELLAMVKSIKVRLKAELLDLGVDI